MSNTWRLGGVGGSCVSDTRRRMCPACVLFIFSVQGHCNEGAEPTLAAQLQTTLVRSLNKSLETHLAKFRPHSPFGIKNRVYRDLFSRS